MTERVIAQKGSYEIEVQAGKKYLWCSCGLSKTQPFCDTSHKGTGMRPVSFVAEKTETVYLCGCKRTKTEPFCDDTHEEL
jgi:CDGSH-type Zn-finger protein